MSKMFVETEDPRVARDITSKALVSTDAGELQRARARRASSRRLAQTTLTLESRMNAVENELASIHTALNTIIEKLSGK